MNIVKFEKLQISKVCVSIVSPFSVWNKSWLNMKMLINLFHKKIKRNFCNSQNKRV